jgi:hypothetical protein
MAVIYYVALPSVRTEEGVAPGEAQELPNERAAIRRAESMSRDPINAGALAFKRSGDPNIGNFDDATILKYSARCRRTWTNYDGLIPVPPHLWHLTILSPFLSVPLPSQFLQGLFFSPMLFRTASSQFNRLPALDEGAAHQPTR